MKRFKTKARSKVLYAAPLAIASSALAVSLIAPQIARASTSNLAPVSPTQLVSWIKSTSPIPLSGTVTGTTSFPVPSASLLNSSNPESGLSGSSTESYNVWANGSGSFRSQQVSAGAEKDLYVTPGSAWLWNSANLTATNEQRQGSDSNGYSSGSKPGGATPGATASEIVSKLSAYSALSVSGSTMVAGRPAFTLTLVPTASDSLIGSIQIAVDGQTHMPVQVQVFPKGSNSPAASLGFVTLTFAPQPSSIFSFTPPSGAKVINGVQSSASNGNQPGSGSGTKVVGKGFDSVAIVTAAPKATSVLGGFVKSLPTISTPAGSAHLYSTPIFEALILPNGTIVAGAVDTSRLIQVASGL
ncbi:MAG: hypothetical protein EPN30_06215 [Actinomycetota bacterium]|nr:MAG: hypothetical protein EPN30_06215 [Actinomycetota bacterium]